MKTNKKLKITIDTLTKLYENDILYPRERDAVEETLYLLKDLYFIAEYNNAPKNKRMEMLKNVGNI